MSTKYKVPVYTGNANGVIINKELQKTCNKMASMTTKELFTVKWRDLEINALPFLVNASSYFSSDYRSMLYGCIADIVKKPDYVELRTLKADELYDVDFMSCILPSLNNVGTKELGMYLYSEKPKDLAMIIFRGVAQVVQEFIMGNDAPHYDYKYQDICNTQAFSFYMSVYWFFHHSPYTKVLLGRDLKKLKLDELLNSMMPEDCIHFKCLKGEISSKELADMYFMPSKSGFDDGSSIFWREVMCMITKGTYNGEDLSEFDKQVCDIVYDSIFDDTDYKLNMAISYCIIFGGTYEKLQNKISTLETSVEREQEEKDKAKAQLSDVRKNMSALKKDLDASESKVKSLEYSLANVKSTADLEKRISELESTIKSKDSEINRLFSERNELKRTISSQKKQLKKLNASLEAVADVEIEIPEVIEEVKQFNFEDAVEKLKDKKLIIVGLDFTTTIDKKLEELGFSSITRFSRTSKSVGNTDFAIIMTNRCHHSDVYKLESQIRGTSTKPIYFNGSNINQLIETLYNELEDSSNE